MDTKAIAQEIWDSNRPEVTALACKPRPSRELANFVLLRTMDVMPSSSEIAHICADLLRLSRDDAPPADTGKARARALINRH